MNQLPFPERPIEITGNLLAMQAVIVTEDVTDFPVEALGITAVPQPVLITIEDITFLPIFTTEEKLRACMKEIDITDYTIKQIEDGPDFLDSVVGQVRVARDPWRTERGTTRFTEVRKP